MNAHGKVAKVYRTVVPQSSHEQLVQAFAEQGAD